jgi:hypothetical protein
LTLVVIEYRRRDSYCNIEIDLVFRAQMALILRRRGHAITAIVVFLVDLAGGREQSLVAMGLRRRYTITKIIVAYHVAMVTRPGVTVSPIVAVFARCLLALRALVASGFARAAPLVAMAFRRRGLHRFVACCGGTCLLLAGRAIVAVAIAAAIAAASAALARYIAFAARHACTTTTVRPRSRLRLL